MTKRKFKEELLQALVPEIYAPAVEAKPKRRLKRVKKEEKIEKKEEKQEGDWADDVELLHASAPRRRVNWRGRKVNRVLRPGTVVSFTPGERSATRGYKREYDEVYGDEDILEQALDRSGEFAYGKRTRDHGPEIAVALDNSNPTPSLKPVTLQQVLPVSVSGRKAVKREAGSLQPTMQLLVPKRQKLEDVLDLLKTDPDVKPDVKIRPIKEVAPGMGVQTVDIQIPVSSAAQAVQAMETEAVNSAATKAVMTDAVMQAATVDAGMQTDPWLEAPVKAARRRSRRPYGPASSLMPDYVLHPSIVPTPGYRGRTYRRRAAATTRRRATTTRRRRTRPSAPIRVRRVTTRRGRTVTLPDVRYHPSIF